MSFEDNLAKRIPQLKRHWWLSLITLLVLVTLLGISHIKQSSTETPMSKAADVLDTEADSSGPTAQVLQALPRHTPNLQEQAANLHKGGGSLPLAQPSVLSGKEQTATNQEHADDEVNANSDETPEWTEDLTPDGRMMYYRDLGNEHRELRLDGTTYHLGPGEFFALDKNGSPYIMNAGAPNETTQYVSRKDGVAISLAPGIGERIHQQQEELRELIEQAPDSATKRQFEEELAAHIRDHGTVGIRIRRVSVTRNDAEH